MAKQRQYGPPLRPLSDASRHCYWLGGALTMLAGLRIEQCRLGAKLPLQGLSQQDHQATPPPPQLQ